MKTRLACAVAVLLAAVTGLSAAPADDSDLDARAALEKATFALVNQERKRDDLAPLKWDDGIAKIAREHSRDMASGGVDFGHGGFGDRIDRLKTLIAGFRGAAENVFMTDRRDGVAEQAVDVWLHSPGHARNIHGDYNYSGLGAARAQDGTLYFTQLFLKTVEGEP